MKIGDHMPGIKAAYLEANSGGEMYPVQIVVQGESLDKLSERVGRS